MAARDDSLDIFNSLVINRELLIEEAKTVLELEFARFRSQEITDYSVNIKILQAIRDNRLDTLTEILKSSKIQLLNLFKKTLETKNDRVKKEIKKIWGEDEDQNPLNVAIKLGNVEAVKILLRSGCPIPKRFAVTIKDHIFIKIIRPIIKDEKAQRKQEAEQLVEAAAELLMIAEQKPPQHQKDSKEELEYQQQIDALLDRLGTAILGRGEYGFTALHCAFFRRNDFLVNRILSRCKDLDLDLPADDGQTPLILAAARNNLLAMKFLLTRTPKADINAISSQGTVLHMVCGNRKGNLEAVQFLLTEVFPTLDIYAENDLGDTALTVAIRRGKIDIVKFFLSKICPKYRFGNGTPDQNAFDVSIETAVREGHLEVVRCLLAHGAYLPKPNKQPKKAFPSGCEMLFTGARALFAMVEADKKNSIEGATQILKDTRIETVIQLLGEGLNARRLKDGDTVLHIAVRNRSRDHIIALLAHGAKVDIENFANETAYDLGCDYPDLDIRLMMHSARFTSSLEELLVARDLYFKVPAEAQAKPDETKLEKEVELEIELEKPSEKIEFEKPITDKELEKIGQLSGRLMMAVVVNSADIKGVLEKIFSLITILKDKIAEIETETDDKNLELKLQYEKALNFVYFRLGMALGTPPEAAIHPVLAYSLLKRINKKHAEVWKFANRIMYPLVLENPEIPALASQTEDEVLLSELKERLDHKNLLDLSDENDDEETPDDSLGRLEDEKSKQDKPTSKTSGAKPEKRILSLDEDEDLDPDTVSSKDKERDKLNESGKGKDKDKDTTKEKETKQAADKAGETATHGESETKVESEKAEVHKSDKDGPSKEEVQRSDKQLRILIEHLVCAEFEGEELEQMLTPLSQYIIEYTKLKGKTGISHLRGIPNFRDFKDPDSFLALLDKIREENLKLIEENEQLEDENAKLRAALAKFDPSNPLLVVKPDEGKDLADVSGDSPFILRQYASQRTSTALPKQTAASPATQAAGVTAAMQGLKVALPPQTAAKPATSTVAESAAAISGPKPASKRYVRASELTRFV